MVADSLHRPLQDLRLSVTDRCNFRCTYCMPKEIFGRDHAFLPKSDILTFEELARVARLFARLGVNKVRVTGGEPLLRRDLPRLIEMLAEIDGKRGPLLLQFFAKRGGQSFAIIRIIVHHGHLFGI